MSSSEYLSRSPIAYLNKETGKRIDVSPTKVKNIVIKANDYLHALADLFGQLGFDVYVMLGQRNVSGFIGEVFSRFFAAEVDGFVINPHPDGRPDLLDLSSEQAKEYFHTKSFSRLTDGSLAPNKSCLAPFKYGGIEVKATIGIPASDYRTRLKKEGMNEFAVKFPRVNYLDSISYWGHHTGCENMVGLYYDYYGELDGAPQIMAVMHAELSPAKDWTKVSIGKIGSKKTSNTSLSPSGIEKLIRNPVVVRNHPLYLGKLRQVGLNI